MATSNIAHPGGAGLPDENEGPKILASTGTLTVLALTTLIARMYVRIRMVENVGWDVSRTGSPSVNMRLGLTSASGLRDASHYGSGMDDGPETPQTDVLTLAIVIDRHGGRHCPSPARRWKTSGLSRTINSCDRPHVQLYQPAHLPLGDCPGENLCRLLSLAYCAD